MSERKTRNPAPPIPYPGRSIIPEREYLIPTAPIMNVEHEVMQALDGLSMEELLRKRADAVDSLAVAEEAWLAAGAALEAIGQV